MISEAPRDLALIGLGEVGQVLAADLHGLGSIKLSAWDRLFPVASSKPSRAVRSLSYLREAGSMAEAISGCSVVISAVTAGECVAAAREAAQALAPGTFMMAPVTTGTPTTRASRP